MTSDMEIGNKSFHLQWNNHLENLKALFECLFNEQILVDVTIACQDGLLRAHKLILSACSPYFEKIFQENPCEYPTLILKGVTLNQMRSLCQYMYMGSVNVLESNLNSLLKVARELQIKGLSEKMMFNDHSKPKPPFNNKPIKSNCSNVDNFEIANGGGSADDGLPDDPETCRVPCEDDSSDNNASSGHAGPLSAQEAMMDEGAADDNGGGAGTSPAAVHTPAAAVHMSAHHASQTTDFQASVAGPAECPTCRRTFINRQNLRRHMQTHSGLKPHRCHVCGLSFLRLSHLQRHHRTHTGERPYGCDSCSKTFSRSDKLRDHVAQQHESVAPAPRPVGGRAGGPNNHEFNLATRILNVANIQNFEEQRVPEPTQELQEPLNLAP